MTGSVIADSGQPANNGFVLIRDLSNVLDLRAYGLDSSGQTSAIGLANTGRLRQAVAAATAGQTILAPAGTYYFENDFSSDPAQLNIGSPIAEISKHVTIAGASQDATVFQAGPADVIPTLPSVTFNFFSKDPGVHFTLRDITVNMPLTNANFKQYQAVFLQPSTTGGTFTLQDATLDYCTCCIKISGATAGIDSNSVVYIQGHSIISTASTWTLGNVGVLNTGGASTVVVRGTPLFTNRLSSGNNQNHHFYSNYMCGLDIDCAGGEFGECGGGYNIQFFGGPEGPPLVARIAGMKFTATNAVGGILGHRFARATPGGSLITELDLSRLVFANTSGVALHAVGDWRMTDCDLATANAGIVSYTSAPLGTGRVFGGLIRSHVQASTAGVGAGQKWTLRGTRLRPTIGNSGIPSAVRCNVAGSTIVLDDCEITGVADKTAQVFASNGKIILRRTALDNLNDAGQTVTITGAPTGGTFLLGDPITTIAVASNGATLPQATINVADATNMPASGNAIVATSLGNQTIAYTGKTGTTLTGATGGTGTLSTGGAVASPTATIAYNSSADTVRTKVQAIASIGANNVLVTPVAPTVTNTGILPATPMLVTFTGTLAGAAHSTLIADASGLTGGTSPAVAVTSTVTGGAVTGVSVATTAGVIDGSATFTNPATAMGITSGSPTGTLTAYNAGGGAIGSPIASADPIAVPFGTTVFHLTGVAAVATINVQASTVMPLVVGYTITIIFDSTATLTAAGNIANAVGASAGQVKTLVWDGTKWRG